MQKGEAVSLGERQLYPRRSATCASSESDDHYRCVVSSDAGSALSGGFRLNVSSATADINEDGKTDNWDDQVVIWIMDGTQYAVSHLGPECRLKLAGVPIEIVPDLADWLDRKMRTAWRNILLWTLLGGQAVGIVVARFGPERYFCWAPYDEITQFDLTVAIDGRTLSAAEAQARYQLPDPARDNRSHAHVIAVITQFERTYGAADQAQVRLNYRINGGEPRQWQWPVVSGTEVNKP